MKNNTKIAYKNISKIIEHLETVDPDQCDCPYCAEQLNGTYLDGLRKARKEINNAFKNPFPSFWK